MWMCEFHKAVLRNVSPHFVHICGVYSWRCFYLNGKNHLHETCILRCDTLYIYQIVSEALQFQISLVTYFSHYVFGRIFRYLLLFSFFLVYSLLLYINKHIYTFNWKEIEQDGNGRRKKVSRSFHFVWVCVFFFSCVLMLFSSSGSFKYLYDWRVENKHGQQQTAENFRVVKIYLLAHGSLYKAVHKWIR